MKEYELCWLGDWLLHNQKIYHLWKGEFASKHIKLIKQSMKTWCHVTKEYNIFFFLRKNKPNIRNFRDAPTPNTYTRKIKNQLHISRLKRKYPNRESNPNQYIIYPSFKSQKKSMLDVLQHESILGELLTKRFF